MNEDRSVCVCVLPALISSSVVPAVMHIGQTGSPEVLLESGRGQRGLTGDFYKSEL